MAVRVLAVAGKTNGNNKWRPGGESFRETRVCSHGKESSVAMSARGAEVPSAAAGKSEFPTDAAVGACHQGNPRKSLNSRRGNFEFFSRSMDVRDVQYRVT